MNERIRELAVKANMTFNGTDLSGSIGRVQCYEDELETFAELIIQECCSAIRLNDVFFGGKFQGAILKHFGVSE
jgi:hypothetical protein